MIIFFFEILKYFNRQRRYNFQNLLGRIYARTDIGYRVAMILLIIKGDIICVYSYKENNRSIVYEHLSKLNLGFNTIMVNIIIFS